MLMLRPKKKTNSVKVNTQRLWNLFNPPESKPREQTFKEVLKELAESSSIHGVPKIVSSRQLAVKILWCLLFFVNFGLFTNQLYDLFKTYYSYPIQTSVALEFSSLLMPAVTICNINPIRKSKLYMSKRLQNLEIRVSKARRNGRRKRDVNSNADTELPENRFVDPSPVEAGPDIKVSKSSTHQSGSFAIRNVEPQPSFNPLHRNLRRRQRNALSESPTASSTSSFSPNTASYSSTLNSTSTTYASNAYQYDYSSSSYYTDSYDNYWYFFDEWNEWHNDYRNNLYTDYEYDNANLHTILEMNSKKDRWEKLEELFEYEFKKENITTRKAMGHQLEDLITSATFAGRVQNVTLSEQFQDFTSYEYGNCYTYVSKQNMVWRSGPKHSIKMTLNLEIDEYIGNFTSGYGVRLVLHEPGTYPLPHSEAITLSPGTETNIGLKAIHMSRTGPPYGSCVKGEQFYNLYGKTFSTSACYYLFRIKKTIEDCKCVPVDAPDNVQLNYTALPICNITDHRVKSCLTDVEALLFSPRYDCQCGDGACKETLFVKTISSRIWPTTNYLKDVLLDELCKKNYAPMQELCSNINSLPDDAFDRHRNNFIRLVIYYESLNYEKITEEPLYESVRFLSDIGGAMGLFMGASLLCFVELLQLLLEILLFIWRKVRSKKETKVETFPG